MLISKPPNVHVIWVAIGGDVGQEVMVAMQLDKERKHLKEWPNDKTMRMDNYLRPTYEAMSYDLLVNKVFWS